MSSDDSPVTGPRVEVYALIGRDDKLLLITDDTGPDVLPGGTVANGEPVEQALRRRLLEQLGVSVAEMDFGAVVEHDVATHEDRPASAVTFLFDVSVVDPERLVEHLPTVCRWAAESDLAGLRPGAVRDGLIANSLSAEDPWLAWTP
jgi:ADP-ribose pyrophosphatase YjhB (NUDIX family)